MKKLFLISCSLILFGSAFSQRNAIAWLSIENPKRGFVEDHSDFSNYIHKGSGIIYSLANDQENLYIRFLANEEVIQRKLIRLGMTIEFQLGDRFERTAKITFLPDPLASQAPGQRTQMTDLTGRKDAYVSRMRQFFAEGFEKTNGQMTFKRPEGLRARIEFDTASLSYELIIPLEELVGKDIFPLEFSRTEITMTASIDALPRPQSDRSREGVSPTDDRFGTPAGRRPAGGAMYPGTYNRMPASGPRYMPVDGNTDLLFKRQRIKRKFRLASDV
jgi:hypothetical protein